MALASSRIVAAPQWIDHIDTAVIIALWIIIITRLGLGWCGTRLLIRLSILFHSHRRKRLLLGHGRLFGRTLAAVQTRRMVMKLVIDSGWRFNWFDFSFLPVTGLAETWCRRRLLDERRRRRWIDFPPSGTDAASTLPDWPLSGQLTASEYGATTVVVLLLSWLVVPSGRRKEEIRLGRFFVSAPVAATVRCAAVRKPVIGRTT